MVWAKRTSTDSCRGFVCSPRRSMPGGWGVVVPGAGLAAWRAGGGSSLRSALRSSPSPATAPYARPPPALRATACHYVVAAGPAPACPDRRAARGCEVGLASPASPLQPRSAVAPHPGQPRTTDTRTARRRRTARTPSTASASGTPGTVVTSFAS